MNPEPVDWLRFAGDLHPALVHLPIGMFVAALFVEIFLGRADGRAAIARRALWTATAVATLVTTTSGWFHGGSGDYDATALDNHRWPAVVMAGLVLIIALLDLFGREFRTFIGRTVALFAAAVVLLVTAHRGGVLTHGRTQLTKNAPTWFAELVHKLDKGGAAFAPVRRESEPATANADVPHDDATLVLELFTGRCERCHGPEKQKGGLRLDQAEGILSELTPGAALTSEIFRRVILPADDLDAMPPEGERISEDQLVALLRWINAGAPMDALEARQNEVAAIQTQRATELEQLRTKTGASIEAIGGEADGGLRVDFAFTDATPTAKAARALTPIAGRIVELAFAGKPVNDDFLRGLPALPALERLHAERSLIGDGGVAAFVAVAPNARYVNLHSSEVTGEALAALARLTRLERLVLFETGVTADELARFRKAHPSVDASGQAALPARPFEDGGPRRVLASDASTGRIALLREVGLGAYDQLWQHRVVDIHDLQLLENGNILFQESWTRILEVDPTTEEVVWSYDAKDGVEIHAFQRLPDDRTMIAESGARRIIEVDRAGRIQVEIPLKVDQPDPHHDTRLARKTKAGTYLVAHEKDGVVREYDAGGTVVWEYEVPLFGRKPASGYSFDAFGNQVFAALRLDDGNTLITTGNGHSVLEVTPAQEIVWKLEQDDLEGIRLAWVTTVQVLSNGNLVIGNCHAGANEPQLIELTRDKDVVWTYRDFDRFGNALATAQVIEDDWVAGR